MTTIVAVKKDGLACIAADTLTSFGDLRLSAASSENKRKILPVGDSFLGLSGSSAHIIVLESYFASPKAPRRFRSRREVFETWRKLHRSLKDQYFLNPKDEDSDPYESTQLTALMATPHGLFGVFSLREVFEFSRFWAMGSGREFALGAMQALYERLPTAQAIAEAAVAAACEFDKSSALPLESFLVEQRGKSARSRS